MGRLLVAFLSLLKTGTYGKSEVIGVGLSCAKTARFRFLIRACSRSAWYRSYFLIVGLVVADGTDSTAAADEAPGVVGVSGVGWAAVYVCAIRINE